MAGNNKRKKKHPNVLLILGCILLTAALAAVLGWHFKREAVVKEELLQISRDAADKEKEQRKQEEKETEENEKEEGEKEDSAEDTPKKEEAAEKAPAEKPEPTPEQEEKIQGISCWGDDLINGSESETFSYMAVLQRTLQENGYDLPVANKTLQGGGTLSMMKMAGVGDDVLQGYITAHREASAGTEPYITEIGIRDLTPEQLDRSDNGYLPVIFMGYYGGWNHDPAELIQQQENILKTFQNQEKFLVVGTKPVDEKVDSAALDAAMSARWQEHYISLAETSSSPASTYEAQDAMAKAIFQKLVDLQYIVK